MASHPAGGHRSPTSRPALFRARAVTQHEAVAEPARSGPAGVEKATMKRLRTRQAFRTTSHATPLVCRFATGVSASVRVCTPSRSTTQFSPGQNAWGLLGGHDRLVLPLAPPAPTAQLTMTPGLCPRDSCPLGLSFTHTRFTEAGGTRLVLPLAPRPLRPQQRPRGTWRSMARGEARLRAALEPRPDTSGLHPRHASSSSPTQTYCLQAHFFF